MRTEPASPTPAFSQVYAAASSTARPYPPEPHSESVNNIIGIPATAQDFDALMECFAPSDGMMRGDNLARLLLERQRGDLAGLARMLVSGELFSFEWQRSIWVPMFQFDPTDMSVLPGPRQVRVELDPKLCGWSVAAWFAQPNNWLDGERPVDMLQIDLSAVRHAVRADRHVATL